MKHYTKLFFAAAVAALGLASCAKEVAPVETPKDNLVTVHFGATAGIEGATKATLTTEDELTFTSAWENGDVLSVKYFNDNETVGATTSGIVSASWSTDHFETTMPEYTGMWDYNVVYPAPNTESKVDFGSTRTQKGNAYNSKYDLMKGGAIEVDADAGKTADGKNIVFEMTRQTAIAYFHLTSTLDEEVVSAKLSVEGNGAYLSTSDVQIGKDNSGNIDYAKGYVFTETEGVASKEINLTFDAGTAPMSSDFKLWFNVLPTIYNKMTLTVETANHTLTISRTAEGMYEAGKLYKVAKKEIPAEKWVKKGGGDTPDTKDFVLVTSAQSDWSGSYLLVGANDVNYYAYDESTNKDETWGKCSEVVVKNNTIASTYGTMALEVVPGTTKGTYSILTPSGKYLSASAKGAFNLDGTYSADNCDFTISFDEKNVLVIKQASSTKNRQIRYNYNNGNGGLRWYEGTSVEPVYLYKGPSIAKYLVSFASVEGGTLSASAIKAEEGTEITLTAEPQLGYEFNNDWSVTATDGTVINVADNKFTMPAQDVTVSGTFSESTSTPTFASLAELVATGTPSTTAAKVTVTLTNEEITDLHKVTTTTGKTYTNGVFLMVGTQEVEVYCRNTPSDWKVGGTISGTLTNCDWKLFVDKKTQKATWELCPADYSELTYKAPLPTCATPVITIAEGGVVSIACATVGATIHYIVGDAPADPTEADAVFSAVTLTEGQTIKAIAVAEGYKPSAVASKKYTVGGATSYFVKVTTAPTDWSGKYLIVFGDNAHSYVDKKDLKSKNTNKLSIIDNKIESNETVNADMVEISKTTNGYKILLSDSKYLSVPASNACGSNTTGSVFTITLGTTGVSISGVDSKNATRTLCNNSTYYRMYTEVKESYTLPQLYKLAD